MDGRHYVQAAAPVLVSQPVSVDHCDIDAANLAQLYLQQNIVNVPLPPFGARCAVADFEVYVDSCEERGDDSAYGFDLYCCRGPPPPPPPPPDTTFGTNCSQMCMNPEPIWGGVTVQQVTLMLGPANPRFLDPTTVCADLFAATRTWMDANLPGPPMCGPNWGANAGGNYVAGTLTMTACNVALQTPQCPGVPSVEVCLNYGCWRKPGPLRPVLDRLLDLVSR